jgi:RHS repeat-associated protein
VSALAPRGGHCFIYGPCEPTIESINNTSGAVLYVHHDQQGSTRLLTWSIGATDSYVYDRTTVTFEQINSTRLVTSTTGKTEASFTYDACGNQTGHIGTVTAPLGYDAQYTSQDTGLIYLRARSYDPATAQFPQRRCCSADHAGAVLLRQRRPADLRRSDRALQREPLHRGFLDRRKLPLGTPGYDHSGRGWWRVHNRLRRRMRCDRCGQWCHERWRNRRQGRQRQRAGAKWCRYRRECDSGRGTRSS